MNNLVDIRTSARHAKNVVIVDDQEVCCSINSAVIKSINRNIKINVFMKTIDALDYINTHKVDLVIADYLMDEMTGLDFIDQVKTANKNTNIDFVIVTVCDDPSIHQAFTSRGARHVFTKPPKLTTLKEVCIKLLYQPSSEFVEQL